MKIELKAGDYHRAELDVGVMEVELKDVYNGVLIRCDEGCFGITQRDGGIEVVRDGNRLYPHEGSQPEFAQARATMGRQLREDEGLRIGYVANVAMLLHDRFDGADFKDQGTREEAANMVLNLMFGDAGGS